MCFSSFFVLCAAFGVINDDDDKPVPERQAVLGILLQQARDDGDGDDANCMELLRRAQLHSDHPAQEFQRSVLFTDRIPFPPPNQRCQTTEDKMEGL